MKNLNYLRRLFATGFGFALFGAGGLLLQLLLLPNILRRRADLAQQLAARRLIGRSWRLFVHYLAWSGVLKIEFHGLEKLNRPGQIILANHPSLLDVVLMIAHVPDINCIVKNDLQRNPVMRGQIRAAGYIPNDESEAMPDTVAAVLNGGQSLLIFPEGTRTGWDGQVRMHRGAVSLGLRHAAVITPVSIKMTPPNFKKGQPWYRIPPHTIHYQITVGDDIRPQDWLAEKPLPIAARRLNTHLQDYFTRTTT